MYPLIQTLVLAALVVLGLFLIARERREARRSALIGALNTVPDGQVGTHGSEGLTRLTDAAFASRYLLAGFGSDALHIAVGTAAAAPLGVVHDEAEGAEESVSVHLLGATDKTRILRAAKAIAVGAKLYAAAGGKVTDSPASGTAYLVGRALTAATADDDEIEAETCFPTAATIA